MLNKPTALNTQPTRQGAVGVSGGVGETHSANSGTHLSKTSTNWDARLLQIAEEFPNAKDKTGGILCARLKELIKQDQIYVLSLTHARLREAIVTTVSMALRCGALLLETNPQERTTAERAANISPEIATLLMELAQNDPGLSQRGLLRKYRLSENQAFQILNSSPLLIGLSHLIINPSQPS
jgi:hypothetical protein